MLLHSNHFNELQTNNLNSCMKIYHEESWQTVKRPTHCYNSTSMSWQVEWLMYICKWEGICPKWKKPGCSHWRGKKRILERNWDHWGQLIEHHINVYRYLMVVMRSKEGAWLFPAVTGLWQNKRQWAKTETKRLCLDIWKTFSWWEWPSSGMDFPEKLWSLHPWRYL